MMIKSIIPTAVILLFFTCCNEVYNRPPSLMMPKASVLQAVQSDSFLLSKSTNQPYNNQLFTGSIKPEELLQFARTLRGIPYKFASVIPDSGFDCSGYITYVFNHFQISVPRASVSFTNLEKELPLRDARPGDLILFTGTDTSIRIVGHMGIIESVEGTEVYFIHASSGKANGVTISSLDDYYRSRFVKLIRVFKDGVAPGDSVL